MLLREELRKNAKNSNFENFGSALYSTSGSMPLMLDKTRFFLQNQIFDLCLTGLYTLTELLHQKWCVWFKFFQMEVVCPRVWKSNIWPEEIISFYLYYYKSDESIQKDELDAVLITKLNVVLKYIGENWGAWGKFTKDGYWTIKPTSFTISWQAALLKGKCFGF